MCFVKFQAHQRAAIPGSDPPSPTNEHDEDADVLDISVNGMGMAMGDVLGDDWETRRGGRRRNASRGGMGGVGGVDFDNLSDDVRQKM